MVSAHSAGDAEEQSPAPQVEVSRPTPEAVQSTTSGNGLPVHQPVQSTARQTVHLRMSEGLETVHEAVDNGKQYVGSQVGGPYGLDEVGRYSGVQYTAPWVPMGHGRSPRRRF